LPAQRKIPPEAEDRTSDGARNNRRLRPLGHSIPQTKIIIVNVVKKLRNFLIVSLKMVQ